eukprot:scaffold602_cov298-Pinguiococcus_pyrenoidosus.AAC.10
MAQGDDFVRLQKTADDFQGVAGADRRLIRGRFFVAASEVGVHGAQLVSDLRQRDVAPRAEPVDHTSVVERRRGRAAVLEIGGRRVHGEDDMHVPLHLARELAEELLVAVAAVEDKGGAQIGSILPGCFSAVRHQRGKLVPFEKPGNVAACQKRIHPLQETRVKSVGLVEDEAQLLVADADAFHAAAQVFVKALDGVVRMRLDLEAAEAVDPRRESAQDRLAYSSVAHQKEMAHWLLEHPVDSEDMVDHVVEDNERHVQLLLVEDLQLRANEARKRFPLLRPVDSVQPVGEENGLCKGLVDVNAREVLLRHVGNDSRAGNALRLVHKPVAEEAVRLVGPDPHQFSGTGVLHLVQGLIQAAYPPAQLAWRVEVLWLLRGLVVLLVEVVDFDHGRRQGLPLAPQIRVQLQQRRVEGAVDLLEAFPGGEVHQKHRSEAEKPVAQGMAADVLRRVASPHELHPPELHELGVLPVEPTLLDDLPHEADDLLGSVVVGSGKVDLVAEDHQPRVRAEVGLWLQEGPLQRSNLFAVGVKGLQQQIRRSAGAEVQLCKHNIRHLAERRRQRHGLAGTGRAAEQQRPPALQPCMEHLPVADDVGGGDDDVRVADFVRLELHFRNHGRPGLPLSVGWTDEVVQDAVLWERNGRPVANEVGDLRAAAPAGGSSEGPGQREHQVLPRIRRDHVGVHGKVRVALLIRHQQLESALKQIPKAEDQLDGRDVHDVLASFTQGKTQGSRGEALVRVILRHDERGQRADVLVEDALLGLALSGAHATERLPQQHPLADRVVGEPDHAASGDGGGRGMLQAVHLHEDANVGGNGKPLAVWQRQQFVVIQHRVEVLRPLRIDVAIKDDPVQTVRGSALVVEDLSEDAREDTIRPLQGRRIQDAVQLLLVHGLGVYHMHLDLVNGRVDLTVVVPQEPQGLGLAGTRRANEHDSVAHVDDVVELHHLLEPALGGEEGLRLAEVHQLLANVGVMRIDLRQVCVGEGVPEDLVECIAVLLHELRHHGAANGADHRHFLGVSAGVAELLLVQRGALEVTCANEDALQRSEAKVVVRLVRELLLAEVEEAYDSRAQRFRVFEALPEEHDLGDELAVRVDHRDGAEEPLEIVRQVRPPRVARIHRDEDADLRVQGHALSAEGDLTSFRLETLLNGQDLLTDRAQNPLLETIEFVKASPGSDLAEAHKDAPHGRVVEGLVTVEHQGPQAQEAAQAFHALRLTCAGGAEGVPSHPQLQGLRQGQVAAIGQRRRHQALSHAQVLVAVSEVGVCHANLDVAVLAVEPHVLLPSEVGDRRDRVLAQSALHIALVHELHDEVLALLPQRSVEVAKDRLG